MLVIKGIIKYVVDFLKNKLLIGFKKNYECMYINVRR